MPMERLAFARVPQHPRRQPARPVGASHVDVDARQDMKAPQLADTDFTFVGCGEDQGVRPGPGGQRQITRNRSDTQ